jgi:hypothetical protein
MPTPQVSVPVHFTERMVFTAVWQRTRPPSEKKADPKVLKKGR